MDANREHAFEDVGRGLDVEDIGLDGPGAKALGFNLILNGDG